MYNKRGFEHPENWGFFFLTWGLVLVFIFAVIWIFFSVGGDVREEQAKTLSDRLIAGLLEDGYLREKVLAEDYDVVDLMRDARIEESVLDKEFYFKVSIGDNEFSYGREVFEIQCFLPGDKMPSCFEREFFGSTKSGGKYKIKILTGSNQLGEEL